MGLLLRAALLRAGLECARASAPAEGGGLEGQLEELAAEGLAVFGTTHELVRTCGDENPPLELLRHPSWLPPSSTRRALEAGLPPAAEAALGLLASAFSTLGGHAEGLWRASVAHAHRCLVRRACEGNGAVVRELRRSQEAFLASAAALLGRAAGAGGGSGWLPKLGSPAQIIARQALAPSHLDLAASLVDGLEAVEPEAAVGMLHDLVLRAAFANCAMLAQLLAHFTLAELGAAPAWRPERVAFEFHGAACCRRYHVLAELLGSLAPRAGAALRMAEVGVNNALTSEYLLARLPGLDFDGVDPYIGASDIHAEAAGRLGRFGPRARLHHATSEVAAARFLDGSLDLVFIDGDHSRDAVLADLRAWRPKVRPGGLLAGHDLFNPAFDGVLEALLLHLNATPGAAAVPDPAETVHFGPDFVWWLQL